MIFFTFSNSVEPDEMQHYAAFHLGLHCLQKWSFRGGLYALEVIFLTCFHKDLLSIKCAEINL